MAIADDARRVCLGRAAFGGRYQSQNYVKMSLAQPEGSGVATGVASPDSCSRICWRRSCSCP